MNKKILPPYNIVKGENVGEAVGLALGAASMCWKPRPIGEFDSQAASLIVDELTDLIFRFRASRDMNETRVPDAVRKIIELSSATDISRSQFKGAVTEILDNVWLTAYEEGRARAFESPSNDKSSTEQI